MRYSDPIENLYAYIMVHGGIDRHERMLDLEWVKDVVRTAREVTLAIANEEQDVAITRLRKVVRARDSYRNREGEETV